MVYGIPIYVNNRKGVNGMKKEYEPIERWQKENLRRVVVKLHKINDYDIIERIDEEPSIQGYIKNLIREDIKKRRSL